MLVVELDSDSMQAGILRVTPHVSHISYIQASEPHLSHVTKAGAPSHLELLVTIHHRPPELSSPSTRTHNDRTTFRKPQYWSVMAAPTHSQMNSDADRLLDGIHVDMEHLKKGEVK